MDPLTLLGTWIAALLTLFILSFLYKDNPFYKFAEYLFVGLSAGYWVAYQFHNVIIPNLINPLFGPGENEGALIKLFTGQGFSWQVLTILAGILGVTMLFRFVPKLTWVSRYGIAFSVGLGAGLSFITNLQANCMAQVQGTIIPPIVFADGAFDLGASLTNSLLIIGVVCGLVYFYFSKEPKGVTKGVSRLGIWFLMVSFGASFGYTIMARISLLIGRMEFLIDDWVIGTLRFLGLI